MKTNLHLPLLRLSADFFRRACALLLTLLPILLLASGAQTAQSDPGLTAHEWGTFTTVAGETGQAVEWLPLNGPSDLPTFVEHFRGSGFKVGLPGTIRMETPVLYFYSSHDLKVDVRASFFHGLITEWYPHASKMEPALAEKNTELFQRKSSGSVSWNSVGIHPTAERSFPQETAASHYYAARAVNAAPLSIPVDQGDQREQFLFYRGVSVAPAPLAANVAQNGQVEATNLGEQEIPLILFFERRGNRIGYRVFRSLHTAAILDSPNLEAPPDGSLDVILAELRTALVEAGLYPDEAQAMLASWQDSWFEEGSRLIYIVPRAAVDKLVPLSIQPAPAELQRVFVGRMELLTPATEKAIETAAVNHDAATLANYGRFLAPMIETMLRMAPRAARSRELSAVLEQIYNSYIAQRGLS